MQLCTVWCGAVSCCFVQCMVVRSVIVGCCAVLFCLQTTRARAYPQSGEKLEAFEAEAATKELIFCRVSITMVLTLGPLGGSSLATQVVFQLVNGQLCLHFQKVSR